MDNSPHAKKPLDLTLSWIYHGGRWGWLQRGKSCHHGLAVLVSRLRFTPHCPRHLGSYLLKGKRPPTSEHWGSLCLVWPSCSLPCHCLPHHQGLGLHCILPDLPNVFLLLAPPPQASLQTHRPHRIPPPVLVTSVLWRRVRSRVSQTTFFSHKPSVTLPRESTKSSSYHGRGLKVRTRNEGDHREEHLVFVLVEGSWRCWGRAALYSPGRWCCLAAALWTASLPHNSIAPAVYKPCFYEVEGTEI